MSMKHILPCAILATSSQLLDNGFFDLIKDLLFKQINDSSKKIRKKINSKSLTQLCLSVVTSLWFDIIKSINTIINKNENNSNDNIITEKELKDQLNSLLELVSGPAVGKFDNANLSSTIFHNSSVIDQCTYGRCLNVNDASSIVRGDLLLTDMPYVFTSSSSCECSEGSILVEHICISWAICLKKKTSTSPNINILLTTLQNTLSNDLTIFLDKNIEKSNNNSNENESIGMNLNNDGAWSLHTQCLMAVISSICTLYFGNDATEIEKNENVWLFMQILSKLPTNTHAVNIVVPTLTKLNSNKTFEDTLEQKRIGYALFLNASSINHSCNPNATFRFSFDSTLSSSLVSSFSNQYSNTNSNSPLYLQALKTMKLDIVAISQINSNNQILVSYGPIVGQNNLINRQKILRNQYLFNCNCNACKNEQDKSEDTLFQESLKLAEIEKNKHLINSINNIRLKILNVSHSMTELFSGINRNNNNLLDSFLFKYLKPIKNELILLQKQYFDDNNSNNIINYENIIFNKENAKKQLFIDICGNLCCIIDMEARILAHQNKYLEAALLISNAIEIMIKSNSYCENDIIIARERVKLSQLYFSSGNHDKAFILSTKAIKDLFPFVSKDDPDLIEANNINQYIRSLNSKKIYKL